MKETFYDKLAQQSTREEISMKNLQIRKQLEQGENPYDGKIIKSNEYIYRQSESVEIKPKQKKSNKSKKKNYEETVNKILDESSEELEKIIEDTREEQERIEDILKKNNTQTKVDNSIKDRDEK